MRLSSGNCCFLFSVVMYFYFNTGPVTALQGVPSWICLGLKSPFIEFKSEEEILANTSITLNLTNTNQLSSYNQNIMKLGKFMKPIDVKNFTKDFIKSSTNVTGEVLQLKNHTRRTEMTENPIAEEMNRKSIELVEEDLTETLLNTMNKDQKFIVPMALKNPTPETTTKPPIDFSANIDELKNHILKLQNLTIANRGFQDKFVVFPGMKSTTPKPPKPSIPETLHRNVASSKAKNRQYRPVSGRKETSIVVETPKQPVTVVPQVLLLNDQTPSDDDDTLLIPDHRDNIKDYSAANHRRKGFSRTTTTIKPARRKEQRRGGGGGGGGGDGGGKRKKNRQNKSCHNVDTPKCRRRRQRRKEQRNAEKQAMKLSRSIRSNKRRNADGSWAKYNGFMNDHPSGAITRDLILSLGSIVMNNNSIEYREKIDTNPDLCYTVDGLSVTQKKLCAFHTNVMPAVSRGARSAIQECKHQFKDRRWNCSTTDDSTVFGPMTSIGSPEMAFVHALAAATVTSFIARACRDGQLTSCGCSRNPKPKQLHDDWSWGGCGDDLEFAYKFSQSFIDVSERDREHSVDEFMMATSLSSASRAQQGHEGHHDLVAAGGGRGDNSQENIQVRTIVRKSIAVSSDVNATATPNAKRIAGSGRSKSKRSRFDSEIAQYPPGFDAEVRELLSSKEDLSRAPLQSKISIGQRLELPSSSSPPSTEGNGNRIYQKSRTLMNLHNNEAGRRAVIKMARITCKCHGISGSCSLITCWQQLASIREIGNYLKEKYEESTEVKLNKRGRLQVRDPRYKTPTVSDLIYLNESPDWCRNDRQLQWKGTHGRPCNKTSSGLDGCGILCCGRGHNTKHIVVRERCNCKFHWCCEVRCDVCIKLIEEHTCK